MPSPPPTRRLPRLSPQNGKAGPPDEGGPLQLRHHDFSNGIHHSFDWDHLKDIKVILAIGTDDDSDLVAFVTVTPKATMPPTADFRYILLKANHEYDQVKVGFNGDDDLSVRIDASMRLADAMYLKNVINQVKNSSDEIYSKIQPQLIP